MSLPRGAPHVCKITRSNWILLPTYLPQHRIGASFSSISGWIWRSYLTNTYRLPPC